MLRLYSSIDERKFAKICDRLMTSRSLAPNERVEKPISLSLDGRYSEPPLKHAGRGQRPHLQNGEKPCR
jgi:hypothetical protein